MFSACHINKVNQNVNPKFTERSMLLNESSSDH